nr:sugar phosphate isomerase/epimerase [Paenibacillus daejeonensis]
MKGISFNTWAYSSFPVWVPSYPLEEVIRRLASFGYDAIEIGCASPHAWPAALTPERRKDILQLLRKERLAVSSMLPAPGGGPGNNPSSPVVEERALTVEHYKDILRLAHDWECPTVIYLPGWAVFGTSQSDAWSHSLEALTGLAPYAKELGITLVVEPTPTDSNLVDSADDALMLAEQSGQDNVKVMFDTFHALYRNEVASDYVYRMGDKLHHIHLADSDRLPPGMGRCDMEAVLKALKETGYSGYLTAEVGFDKRAGEPDWYAKETIAYLQSVLKKHDWR